MGNPRELQLLMAFCIAVLWMQWLPAACGTRIADPILMDMVVHCTSRPPTALEAAAPARHGVMEMSAIAALSGGSEMAVLWALMV